MKYSEQFSEYENSMIEFAQQLIRIRSYSGCEREIADLVKHQMIRLGYDSVTTDAMGNVIGRIGKEREPEVLLDSHMDTVAVKDDDSWSKPAFGGEIHGGRLYGRGAVDMKSALAASVFAGAAAKTSLESRGKTAVVTCSVCEECCDGEALYYILTQGGIHPQNVLICEPSDNRIMLGHKGKLQTYIVTRGISAHGAAPHLGENAVYEMSDIIRRVEQLNSDLQKHRAQGTVTLTDIFCTSASPNAVPDSCSIRLDRRLAPGETERQVIDEMNALISGKKADWFYDELSMQSWTGYNIRYKPLHLAWHIEKDHPLAVQCSSAYQTTHPDCAPDFGRWDFSTNAVASVSLGIPTIGFGPGDPAAAHTSDEHCSVKQMVDAFRFYTTLLSIIEPKAG